MRDKVVPLNQQRRKKNGPADLQRAARLAARRFLDNAPADVEEPRALASGSMESALSDRDDDEDETPK